MFAVQPDVLSTVRGPVILHPCCWPVALVCIAGFSCARGDGAAQLAYYWRMRAHPLCPCRG